MKNKYHYFDYAATTPVDPRVLKAMQPYFSDKFANTMSLHSMGQEAKFAVEESRQVFAKALNCLPEEIFFTSSATESNNTVLKGIALANKSRGNHIIISSIEHSCIIESAKCLESQDFKVTRLKIDKFGMIDPEDVRQAITDKTILISVIHASNEIGAIEPIAEIGRVCKERGVCFHTDASQSFGKIAIDVKKTNIDLLTASSHKMYGPKGVGLLYIRKGIAISPLLSGGGQERGLRSSTVNVSGIVGFAKATEICLKEMKKESRRLIKLRDRIIKTILKTVPNSYLNGHPLKRLPNNVNLRFDFIEGEALVIMLDNLGIEASTGSACSSVKLEPSHVLIALGLKPQEAHGSLRLSLGRETTQREVDYLLKNLPEVVERLRKISPFKAPNGF